MIVAIAILAAVAVTTLLTFSRFAKSTAWRATVTPLASIIGSGFLICGPLLAREFGSAAILAMAALLAIAYAVGAVIRFNIIHVENIAPKLSLNDPMAWAMRAAQVMLAIAYAVSVAYYLKLLAEFTMKPLGVTPHWHGLTANILVTVIILVLTALTFSGDIRKIEHAAHASVSVKLGIIAGLLAGLALWWSTRTGAPLDLPPTRLSWGGIPMLLGLLITVQGFETSRYMGDSYDQATRVKTMRYAQWLSSAIYLAFLALLTPFLSRAQHAEGVAGILDIMKLVAPALGIFVLIGAVSSQLSAAIADSIGSGGLMVEVSRRKLGVRGAFITASALSIAVVWLTDPFSVIALSSRAFAMFYAMQAVLALWVSIRTGKGSAIARAGFVIVGLVCLVAALAGAPAEG
ncbi:hypothetical protein [Sphingomonas sp. 10B4]|uniref:hypothetical protein n=1 Tax=Sphingomonas sp. 10B4 TaxID=3048575 RepID=UPI002AB40644|nr:hypothetical protein [Sphingomonas sp. 10B4]MDY7524611.1 hypothetical protein [Sphingomonas sp. 10B4]MEB0282432.1 hypothetical protein [Sphingomonas sp. 10B4]